MDVRAATVEDARAMAEIHVEAWKEAYQGVVPAQILMRQSVQRRQEWWTARLAEAEGSRVRVDVAVTPEDVVGFCAVGHSRDDDADQAVGEVHAIYVAPVQWAGGAGSALLASGEERLREELGNEVATLWVLKHNIRTREWYQRRGWGWDRGLREEKMGRTRLAELRYRKPL